MVQRPYIRQGSVLSAELRSSTKHWPELPTFLNGLRNTGTESERETRRVNHVTELAEIDILARKIYNTLMDHGKKVLSMDEDLVYPGLVR